MPVFLAASKEAVKRKFKVDNQFLEFVGHSINNHVPVTRVSHLECGRKRCDLVWMALFIVTYS